MSAAATLDGYIAAARRNLRALIWSRAGAASGIGILLLSVAAVWFLQRRGFPETQVWLWRGVLALLLLGIATILLWRPLQRLARAHGANELEARSPEQQGRIVTYMEQRQRGEPSLFTELLAQDALNVAAREAPTPLLRRALPFAAVAVVSVAVIAALMFSGKAGWGYGTRHLLLGTALPADAASLRSLRVLPGNATLRRNADLRVTAAARGFDPDSAQLMVRFDDAKEWEHAQMRARGDGNFEFTLFALHGPLRYRVNAAGVESVEHVVNVVEAPRIDGLKLTYHYPEWTGLENHMEDASRDIRAVAGTAVDVEILSSVPLTAPVLLLDQDQPTRTQSSLQSDGTRSTGRIDVTRPGRYRIAARVANEIVPLSDEYEIEVLPDHKPTIEIVKPGRDARASSIEEVPVRVRAEDDFKLRDVELRYAVNGGKWEAVNLARGKKTAEDTTLLRLEEVAGKTPLQPGDLVSYYAVARDHQQSVQTDLYMVQVQAFDRRFTQGGEGGAQGGGGAAEEQNAISERQREILLATWNLQRERDADDKRDAASTQRRNDSSRMLGELQSTLAQQTRTLAERTKARAGDEDPRVAEFLGHLEHAATAMQPAAAHLQARKLDEAIPVEQQALQHLQRAEATFRDIQVSRQQGGGAGGSGQQAGSDLAELFELEMDLEKNQYETESRGGAEQAAKSPELDEALRKLKELAARQEKLAQESARQNQTAKEQSRWQQDQLRREAEELKRKLEQLALEERQQQQGGSQSRNGSQSGSSTGDASSRQGAASAALESLQPALDQMRNANAPGTAEQAARRLREALDKVDREQSGGAQLAASLYKLADEADRMSKTQRDVQQQLQDALSKSQRLERDRALALADTKGKLLEELNALQGELRAALAPGKDAPQTRQRVGEILDELGKSGAATRLGRSAGELQSGRAREVAPREGLITEALERLAKDLHDASRSAAREAAQGDQSASPEQLLAEIAELRTALADAQSRQQQGQGQRQSAGQGQSQSQRGAQGNAQGEQQGGQPGASPGQGGGMPGAGGLGAWNAIGRQGGPHEGSSTPQEFAGPLAPPSRELSQLSNQLEQLESKLRAGNLSRAEIDALRRLNRGVRNLQAGELAARADAVRRLVERVELAALAAARQGRRDTPANASPAVHEAPAQREASEEYYRRLGGS
ncbi:MAG: hypothetical protein ABIT36_04210 [Steroidobacteraceae bacterium]